MSKEKGKIMISREDSSFKKLVDYIFSTDENPQADLPPKGRNKELICKDLKVLYDKKNIKFYEKLCLYHRRNKCGYFCRKTSAYPDVSFEEKDKAKIDEKFRKSLDVEMEIECKVYNYLLDRLILIPSLELNDEEYCYARNYIIKAFFKPDSIMKFSTMIDIGGETVDLYVFCEQYLKDKNKLFVKYFGKKKEDVSEAFKTKIETTILSKLKNEIEMVRASL